MTDVSTEQQQFLTDVLSGLSASPKTLPCKYFYDERGSQLFEKICELEEYYLTRSELELMRTRIDEMIEAIGTQCRLVEFGSGSSLKTRLILERLQIQSVYLPVDISEQILMQTARQFREEYPQLLVQPVCADFTQPFELPQSGDVLPTIVYFPGSTIGNFDSRHTVRLLRRIRDLIGNKGGLLIGFDLQKDRSILEAAYDDSPGVTAEFNRNLLERINSELGANFELSRFEHRAIYNEGEGRIEMHLVSMTNQRVTIGNRRFSFDRNEAIHTENSYKYTVEGFTELAAQAGMQAVETWFDSKRYFAVQFLKVRCKDFQTD